MVLRKEHWSPDLCGQTGKWLVQGHIVLIETA
jgi:hypothetical protein